MTTTTDKLARCNKCTIILNSGGNAAESTTSPGLCVGCERFHARPKPNWIGDRYASKPKVKISIPKVSRLRFDLDLIASDCERYCEKNRLSRNEFSDMVGVNHMTIVNMMNKKSRPYIGTVRQICAVTGADMTKYYGGG